MSVIVKWDQAGYFHETELVNHRKYYRRTCIVSFFSWYVSVTLHAMVCGIYGSCDGLV